MGKLTVAKVRSAKPRIGADGVPTRATFQDGDGLFLLCAPTGAKSWMLRVQVEGKRRDIGLGAVDLDGVGRNAFAEGDNRLEETPLMLRKQLTLAEAREKAAALRKLAKAGANPVGERDRLRSRVPTFAEAVTEAHTALSAGWADRTAKAFLASLQEHAIPKLGTMRVDAIGSAEVITALDPIWTGKPVMARKVRSRIGQVLAFAKARGWRKESLPDARELRSGLSKQKRGGNFRAMPFADVPAFVADELAKHVTASRYAMLFGILTAARSGEVRQATWKQVDLKAKTWTRSAAMMKMNVDHVVTLSEAAVALLERFTPKDLREGIIFPGTRGKALSDMSLTKVIRSAGSDETMHGFRSSFRDWAAEKMPTIPAMVAEMALAHKVGTATEQAYLRTDLRDMRRDLLEGWGRFVAPSLSGTTENVIALERAKKV
ncbi:tyrosine-type recombinase/integrase [Novosphingobium mangrovi (ex Huang et al. 2023)]|uniref:Tyrosine-type recombinase/integrase n=1 Tax=Novosphingobium mangrovi (ex Huang et al. 2023) TaxID=2976432 RepID=A0ABT2I957_9SPHN|nr:site-specific integrase [Novosphingobium mangrovi (ex Huang et al. 2023)]MCT2401371.1 tyrosine-type recombinase/integrase [Novosphingobium mangrovi (ex Huang et al. 2023)]